MLAIRMQRTGRTGHAQFRLIVQDSRFSPKSGRVVAYIGSYNPHSKAVVLNKEKAQQYLSSGAQPSPRLAKILKNEGVKLPDWVNEPAPKKRTTRNPEKLRKNRPSSAKAPSSDKSPEDRPGGKPAEEAKAAAEPTPEKPAPPAAKAAGGAEVAGETEAKSKDQPTGPAEETQPAEDSAS